MSKTGKPCLGLYRRHLNVRREHGKIVERLPKCARCGRPSAAEQRRAGINPSLQPRAS